MNVIILGAGASKSYNDSVTKVKMPIAKDFFQIFNKLEISKNRWVLVGAILNYLKSFHNMTWLEFLTYTEDIEKLHSEVEEKLNTLLQKNNNFFGSPENIVVYQTYMQLIFVFTSVINEIQNGELSISHLNFAKNLNKEDFVVTFNWDTLMDRALKETSSWNTDNGYLVKPTLVYRNGWNKPDPNLTSNCPTILKLHGSTNWLTSYLIPDGNKLKSLQETPPSDFYIYESTINPYSTYNGRYMSGYSDFAYGYYPPNLPLLGEKLPDGHLLIKSTISLHGMPEATAPSDGLVSMPLIIPPVKNKNYSHFGTIFSSLWNKAEESLAKADRIIIIGYSFPPTDTQTDSLFKSAFIKRTNMPDIVIVDPMPEQIKYRFIHEYGILKNKITTFKEYFNKEFKIEKLFK